MSRSLTDKRAKTARLGPFWRVYPSVNLGGVTWLPANRNASWLNYEAQDDDPDSVLSFYRHAIEWRRTCAPVRHGDFTPVYADRAVLAYRRTIQDGSSCTIWLNMSGKKRRPKALREVASTIVVTNTGRTQLDGCLEPWEALVLSD